MKQLALATHSLGLPTGVLSPLLAYARLVEQEADRLGLMSEAGVADLLDLHIPASLAFAAVRAPLPGETWVDVGSGAGLPGLPLAICYPETRFVLVEPQARRAGFLELACLDLGVDASVEARRVQALDVQADVAVTRAFSSREASGGSAATLTLLSAIASTAVVQVARDAQVPHGADSCRVDLGTVDSEFHFLIMRS